MERDPREGESGGPEEAREAEAGPVEEAAGAAGPGGDEPAAEAAELRDRWLRAEAEAQNIRRRAARERDELRREIEDRWLLEAVGLLDDLERGLAAARESGAPEAWTRGFDLAGSRIRELLERHGVTLLDPVGQPFDPRFHEALLEVPAPEGSGPGRVANVVARGVARDGRSLRPARVAVTRAPDPEGDSPA